LGDGGADLVGDIQSLRDCIQLCFDDAQKNKVSRCLSVVYTASVGLTQIKIFKLLTDPWMPDQHGITLYEALNVRCEQADRPPD
jgi:hypothetical protein